MKRFSDDEFKDRYDKYHVLLLHIAYSYTLDTHEAEDIVQESFFKLFQKGKGFKDDEHEKNWLIRVLVNKSIDFLRRKKNVKNDNEYIYQLEDESKKDQINVNKLVERLSDKYRTIIVLHYYNNLSINDISKALNISEDNVKVRLNRARAKLKEMREDYE